MTKHSEVRRVRRPEMSMIIRSPLFSSSLSPLSLLLHHRDGFRRSHLRAMLACAREEQVRDSGHGRPVSTCRVVKPRRLTQA